jgi:uncharacterized protein YceK
MMNAIRRCFVVVGLAAALTVGSIGATSGTAYARFNDEYVYASTRAVHSMDAHPAAKVTLYPITVVVDTAFLPFAVIAGFVTG